MKKIFVFISVLSLCAVCFAAFFGCSDYTYEIIKRGSHVEQIDEVFECNAVEKFPDFKSFSKSSIAAVDDVVGNTYSETKYTKEFFKNSDLVVLKFEYDASAEFFVESVIAEGNSRIIKIQGVKLPYGSGKEMNYVFFETAENVSKLDYTLEIGDVTMATGTSMMYIASDNQLYKFENEDEPTARVFSDGAQIDIFIENDPILTNDNYAAIVMRKFEKNLSEYDLLCVKVLSTNITATILDYAEGTAKIKTFFSDHYSVDVIPCHRLVILLIPKNLEINEITVTSLKEYDGTDGNLETKTYQMTETGLSDYREYVVKE